MRIQTKRPSLRPASARPRSSFLEDGRAHARGVMIGWLNDAYAMEQALAPVLDSHALAARDGPAIRRRIERHAVETRRHAALVEECLLTPGARPSTTQRDLAGLLG